MTTPSNVTPLRDAKGRFPKGSSGNPNGISSKEKAIRELHIKAKEETLTSIFEVKVPSVAKLMFAMLRDEKTSDENKIKICMVILDRAIGKPVQSMKKIDKSVAEDFDLGTADPETRKAMIKALKAASDEDDADNE